jgi:hypothetical protein
MYEHNFDTYLVKYIIIEPDSFALRDLIKAPVIRHFTNLGFTPVSELC